MKLVLGLSAALASALMVTAAPTSSSAAELSGTWRGGGTMRIASNNRSERVRCRASFSKLTRRAYNVRAVCSTTATTVAQTARVRRTGPNRFSGRFFNSQFNIRGSIFISVRGRRQSISLRSAKASASLQLSKR
ncbi:MAG: hypothetical protein AAFR04_07075 [Pseudomonadota bacterium]